MYVKIKANSRDYGTIMGVLAQFQNDIKTRRLFVGDKQNGVIRNMFEEFYFDCVDDLVELALKNAKNSING